MTKHSAHHVHSVDYNERLKEPPWCRAARCYGMIQSVVATITEKCWTRLNVRE